MKDGRNEKDKADKIIKEMNELSKMTNNIKELKENVESAGYGDEKYLRKIDSEHRMIDMILDPTTPELWLNPEIKDFFDFDNSRELKDVKVKGSIRRIDQICFFERTNEKNQVIVFYKDGKYTGNKIPKSILDRFNECEQFESFKKLRILVMVKVIQW